MKTEMMGPRALVAVIGSAFASERPWQSPRRRVLIAACATVATLLTKTEAVASDPKFADIQALVSDLRNVDKSCHFASGSPSRKRRIGSKPFRG